MVKGNRPRLPASEPGVSAPLDDDAFEQLMARLGPFETRPHIAVAVSGGSDSLCLALLAARWAGRREGRVTALTVDHGLRPDAAQEARRVRGWLGSYGIDHHILPWRGQKPPTGVQAAARRARYGLMRTWCREAGILHLLLAHTRDDQAETLLMRLGSGSGPDGLAAMTAIREIPDVRILRPLLSQPKAALQAMLAAEGQEWIDDPSNRDNRFARTRVRRAMKEGGFRAEDLARSAQRFGRARVALEAAASRILACSVNVHPAGFARLDLAPLKAAPEEVSLRAIGRVLSAVGGRDHGPGLKKLERLHRDLMNASSGSARTLAGCRVIAGGGEFLVCRETRGAFEPVAVHPGLRLTWDNRFDIRFAGPGLSPKNGPWLGRLESKGFSEIVRIRPELRASPIPGPARPSLPALIDDAGVVQVPHIGYRRPAGLDFGPDPGVEFDEIRFRPPNTLSNVGFFLLNGPDILSL